MTHTPLPVFIVSAINDFKFQSDSRIVHRRIDGADDLNRCSRRNAGSVDQRSPGLRTRPLHADGEFHIPVGPMIQLKAQFTREAAAHLYETSLSTDQTIEPVDAGHLRVSATVRQTAQLEWWLLGFGSSVRVLEPPALADRITEAVITAE